MCGNKNTSTTTQTAPNPAAMSAYEGLLGQAGNVAQTPFNPYGGEFTAPVNAQQQTGIGDINTNANYAQPYIGQAAGYAQQAAQPLTAAQIQQYQNPYTQQVVNATQAQFNNQNAQQQASLVGNAGAQGALGGDRVGVAQANLAGQQQTAQAPVIAGLESQGYTTGLSTALAEQQNLGNSAYSLGNLGVAGQNAALTGASAQVGAGTLEQQTQQQQDAALYNQFEQQQAYPFQTTQWLAGIDTGVGSQMGGTSQTTPPAPNPWNTILGLGVAGLGAFAKSGANRGGRIHRDIGGGVAGTPYASVQGYVPTMQIARGSGAPKAPAVTQAAAPSLGAFGQAGKGLGNLMGGSGDPLAIAPGSGSDALGSFQNIGTAPESGFGMGALYAKGGRTTLGAPIMVRRGYDDGGVVAGFGGSMLPPPSFDDRFANANAPTFDQRFGPPPAPVPPAIYNALQDYGTTQPDALNGLLAEPAPDVPLPRARPQVASASNNPDLPPEVTVGASAPPAADLGDTPMALGYAPSNIGSTASPGDAANPEDSTSGNGIGSLSSGFLNLSPAARQGIITAGLGMMASRSPYLGQAVGEGGLQGLSAYSGEQKQELATKKTQADIDRGKQQLAQAAKTEADRIAFQTKQLQQSHEDHEATLKQQRDLHMVPPGYRQTELGNLEAVPGGPQDPAVVRAEAEAKRVPGMSDEALQTMVQSYRAGNTGVVTGVGRGTQGADNLNRFWNILSSNLKAEGATGADLASAKANFTAQTAAARTAAVREANVNTSVEEAKQTFPLVREASAALPRSQFVPWNRMVQAVQAGTSSPELARLVTAIQGARTAYAQAMSRTGVTSVHAMQSADELLNRATSQEALEATLGQMEKEMGAAQVAPELTRKAILDRISGHQQAAPGAAQAPAAGAAQGFTGRTATGPNGAKLRETSDGHWVP